MNTMDLINENEFNLNDKIDLDNSVNTEKNQTKIDTKIENLFWELINYRDEMYLPMFEKLNQFHLMELLYPNIKRV